MKNVYNIGLKYKEIMKTRELMAKRLKIIKAIKPSVLQFNPGAVNYQMGADTYTLRGLVSEITERSGELAWVRNENGKVLEVNWRITSDGFIEVRVKGLKENLDLHDDFFIMKEA